MLFRSGSFWSYGTGSIFMTQNMYYSGGYKYKTSNAASLYTQGGFAPGTHAWYVVPSGTAGTSFTPTQAMTLNNSGYLGINTTSPTSPLTVMATSSASCIVAAANASQPYYVGIQFTQSDAATVYGAISMYQTNMRFFTGSSETMRLDSSGNLNIGTTSQIQAWRTGQVLTISGNAVGQLQLDSSRADSGSVSLGSVQFTYSTNSTNYKTVALIEAQSTGGTANQRGGFLNFYTSPGGTTSPSVNMVLDGSGNLGIGTSTPASYGKLAVNGSMWALGGSAIGVGNSDNSNYSYISNSGSSGANNANMQRSEEHTSELQSH